MKDKKIELRNDALRLAYAIERQSEPATVRKLAQILNYDPAQLQKDIAHLARYVSECSHRQSEE